MYNEYKVICIHGCVEYGCIYKAIYYAMSTLTFLAIE